MGTAGGDASASRNNTTSSMFQTIGFDFQYEGKILAIRNKLAFWELTFEVNEIEG